jgi:hypothetical protein
MSWILPVPLLLFAGMVALRPLAALMRRPTAAPRLFSVAFVTALAIIALVWLAWVPLWLLEQRWRTLRVPPALSLRLVLISRPTDARALIDAARSHPYSGMASQRSARC